MHGLGNDFVLLDGVSRPPPPLPPQTVRQLSDRRLGIGFDQLLLLLPAADAGSDFHCRIFNADGGEVGQCGNGVRCAHVFLLQTGHTTKKQIVLHTLTTRLTTKVVGENRVRVVMPPAEVLPPQQAVGYHFQHLNIGNPHYICLDGAAVSDEKLAAIGEQLNAAVVGGVNVGFAAITDGGIELRVYERGAGLTAACGSGALAAAVSAIGAGKTPNPATVRMPGGVLLCGVLEDGGIWLEGGVTHVFDGNLLPIKNGDE